MSARPASAPAPAPAVDASAASSADVKDVEAAVQAWAAAWSSRDVAAYLATYSSDFNGGKSRKAWEAERRSRIEGKSSISVKLSNVSVQVNGDRATARFHQDYVAGTYKSSGRKTLELQKSDGRWVITKESSGA
ncbi:nuclear transport factor 2 family protein [Xylophilus sp.]|uniref:nuclear transport factor 2 family protein n=1 Tax=Xylophilus sp. TaxID=2653893 RepID=UPI0013BC7471|nr:nuclear transport factor 2 family protein [Xylophilus sp.]KAF1047102.1 MAG: hypothetical protein GAK38_02147 [Xylophilus sp.]